jgi:hypothetical protein
MQDTSKPRKIWALVSWLSLLTPLGNTTLRAIKQCCSVLPNFANPCRTGEKKSP